MKAPAMLDRIRARCEIDPETGCWNWQGCRQANGYGRIAGPDGKTHYTHRAAYAAARGPIRAGLDICHRCDNRQCCNPAHLFAGTRLQNMRDCAAKDRVSRGRRHAAACAPAILGRAKLDQGKADAIRSRLAAGDPPCAIAPDFGVSESTVLKIRAGRAWPTLLQRIMQ